MSGLGLIRQELQKTNSFDQSAVKQLALAIGKKGRSYSINSKEWEDHFRKLRARHSEEKIKAALDWFSANVLDKYCPLVKNANHFCKKFDQIYRHVADIPLNIEPGVEITEKARKLKNDMNLNWPGEEHLKELAFIQLNLNYCESFSRRLKKVYEKLKEECDRKDARSLLLEGTAKSTTRRLLLRVIHLYHCHSTPIDMTRWWSEHVNNTAWNWSGWQGNILAWVLTDSNPRFNMMMSRIIADEFGSGSSWTQIKSLIYKEK